MIPGIARGLFFSGLALLAAAFVCGIILLVLALCRASSRADALMPFPDSKTTPLGTLNGRRPYPHAADWSKTHEPL